MVSQRLRSVTAAVVTAALAGALFGPGVQAALSNVDVQPASLVAGAKGDVVINFTTSLSLGLLDTITITFPSGFDVANATKPTDCTGATGDGITTEGISAIAVVGQVVTLTYNGPALSEWESGAKSCTIGNITNPTTAGSTGTYSIATTLESAVTASADTIVAAALSTVVFTTEPTTTDADTTKDFDAEPRDQFGNVRSDTITYSIDSGSGSVNGTGVFTPNKTGTTVINASSGSFYDTASITVSVGAADDIVFSSSASTTDADTNKTFTAVVQDANDNNRTDTITYSIDSGSGSINSTGVFDPDKVGTTVVKAAAGALSVTHNITVTVGATAQVVFSSAPSTTDTDTNKTFTAGAQDANGNAATDTISYSIDSGSGSINSTTGVFSPNGTGTTVINATTGTIWKTVEIVVNAVSTSTSTSSGGGGGGGSSTYSTSTTRASHGYESGEATGESTKEATVHAIKMDEGLVDAMTIRTVTSTPVTVYVTTYDDVPPNVPEGYRATPLYVGLALEPKEVIQDVEVSLQPVPLELLDGNLATLVVLHERDDGTWEEVPTTFVVRDDDMVVVSFVGKDFSDFAAVFDERVDQADASSGEGTEGSQAGSDDAPSDAPAYLGPVAAMIAMALVGAVMLVTLVFLRRHGAVELDSRDDEYD